MPEKIKELRCKNEENFKYADESFNQTSGAGNLMGGGYGGAVNLNSYLHHTNLNYTNHQSFYQHKLTGQTSVENQYHDFEDFLNLVNFEPL